MKKHLILLVITMLVLSNSSNYAQTVVNINGIRYLIENEKAIVGRQDKDLSGDIVIPPSIEHDGRTFPVTEFVQPTNLTAWSSNTVTTEGGAFQSCPIKSVIIPPSISTIAAGAFADCTYLQSVELPNNLKSIGAASFSNCVSLEYIDIPESVNSFGSSSQYGFVSYTFGGCSKLKTIHIPTCIKALNAGCFKGAGIDSIYIPQTITALYDDCLASPNLRIVKMGIADLSKINYSQACFGVGNIDNANLYIPKGSITVYQEYEPWSNFKSIQEYGEEGETFVPDQVNIIYNGLKYILKEGRAIVSKQPQSLAGDIIIPEKVSYNEKDYPVTSITAPTDLVCYSNNTILCTGGAFQGSNIESISIPSSITTIEAGTFQNCRNLKKVLLPSTVTKLCAACFAGCYNLEEINIPDGLNDLGSQTNYGYRSYVFGECRKIKSIKIPSGVKTLASGCFLNSGLETIIIPASCSIMAEDCLDTQNLRTVTIYVRNLDNLSYTESCFGNVSNTELVVPKGCKQVYQEYYPWMSFKSIVEFDDGNEEFVPTKIITRINNIRYILDGKNAIIGRQNKDLSGDITIPSSVTYEGKEYVVNGMVTPTNLISWSSNTVSTENGAFQTCPISSITLPPTISVISAGAFYGCSNLESINIPEGVKQLGAACFAGCSKLVEIQIPESVNDFGGYTKYGYKSFIFGDCTSLKKINIPKNITKLTEGCFKGSGLEIFIIPSNVVKLEEDCFNMSRLKGIKITHTNLNTLTYTESIFSNVSNVSLYVPEGTANLYKEFYPWKNFKEIVEYKDQDDEFYFNAYGISYMLTTESSSMRGNRAQDETESLYLKEYIASGISLKQIGIPSKEGYTFSGWSNLPKTMPAHDIIVTGSFTVNKYKLTYKVDDQEYKSFNIEFGSTITAETNPTKEGYTFSGWSEIPTTMPANDVVVTGSFTVNKYKLTYKVDDQEYKSFNIEFGSTITAETNPTKEGYTFSGWSEIPTTMPANDVIVEGTFSINSYTITYMIDDAIFDTQNVEYAATITPPTAPTRDGYSFEWLDVPATMPANDITIIGSYTSGVGFVHSDEQNEKWYTLEGKPINTPRKGINIKRTAEGKTKKVMVKY